MTNSRVFDRRSEKVEKIILVNTVETPSQPSSSEINEYGKVVKIAITDGQQMLFCQVVLAKQKTTAITTNYLENTTKALERVLADAYTSVRGCIQVSYKRLRDRPNSPPGCKRSFIAYPVSTISRFCQQKIKVQIKLDIERNSQYSIALSNESDDCTQSLTTLLKKASSCM